MKTFDTLGLADPILQAVRACGYETPTPIQAEAIPPLLAGEDVLGCAQTGTGKTAAFALPVLNHLYKRPARGPRRIRALVLSPTRELAAQIGDSFEAYSKNVKIRHQVIFGGVGQAPQVRALRQGVDVLVACPGRLLDLHGQGHVDLRHVEFFVLDEADRMLDMGFIHDVRRVLRVLPAKKQNLLFSATMPNEIVRLASEFLDDPITIEISPEEPAVDRISQSVMFVEKANKRRLLAKLLVKRDVEQAIVFTRTKHGANRLVRHLERDNIAAMAIHGNKSQGARTRALDAFRDGSLGVLVATDVASRGIDVDGVSHVFNFDLPNVPESYVHRIGRTARAGRDGIAIAFCDASEGKLLRDIERLLGEDIPVDRDHEWHVDHPQDAPPPKQASNRSRGGGGGGGNRGGGRRRRRRGGGGGRGRAPQR